MVKAMAKPFFPWVGGKEKLIPYIRQMLPPVFFQYVEPFGGGGAMLLGLPPKPNRLDIYNDYNNDLSNLFLCTRDRPLALVRDLKFLPLHSRREFELLLQFVRHEELLLTYMEEEREVAEAYFPPEDMSELVKALRGKAELFDVRRAANYFRRCRYSFSGTTNTFGVRPCNLEHFFCSITSASKRLQEAVVENKDGVELIHQRDRPDGVLYCDPPYYEAEGSYESCFTRRDHVRLWAALRECRGYTIISYNDCPYIRNLYKDFYMFTFKRNNPLSQQAGAEYGELLIANFDPRLFFTSQITIFPTVDASRELRLIREPAVELRRKNNV